MEAAAEGDSALAGADEFGASPLVPGDGCVQTGGIRTRLGSLDGVSDDWLPADNQPHGDGLYSGNACLHGTFLLAAGEDAKTRFGIVKGHVTSVATALRNDSAAKRGCLNGSAFGDGLEKWNTEDGTVPSLPGTNGYGRTAACRRRRAAERA